MMGISDDSDIPAEFVEKQTSEYALDGMNRQSAELSGFGKVLLVLPTQR
jgi:hypothetical protein